jgi:endonuclease III
LDPPVNWQEIYKNIQKMRETKNAPVDSMGCEECASGTDEKSRRFQILVSLMISSQTKDRKYCLFDLFEFSN